MGHTQPRWEGTSTQGLLRGAGRRDGGGAVPEGSPRRVISSDRVSLGPTHPWS